MNDTGQLKVVFELEHDADGYPPYTAEGLWTTPLTEGRAEVESIPFFAKQVSPGDLIVYEMREGTCHYVKTEGWSYSSVLRTIVFDEKKVDEVQSALQNLGGLAEVFRKHKLVAIEVPETVRIEPVQEYLRNAEAAGLLTYEEASIRHEV